MEINLKNPKKYYIYLLFPFMWAIYFTTFWLPTNDSLNNGMLS